MPKAPASTGKGWVASSHNVGEESSEYIEGINARLNYYPGEMYSPDELNPYERQRTLIASRTHEWKTRLAGGNRSANRKTVWFTDAQVRGRYQQEYVLY
jgi:hypothetical protein